MTTLFQLSLGATRLRDLSQRVYDRPSGDPTHECNRSDADWQAGYLYGCFTTRDDGLEDIRQEWQRRRLPDMPRKDGKDAVEWAEFRNWKAGYNAGRFSKIKTI